MGHRKPRLDRTAEYATLTALSVSIQDYEAEIPELVGAKCVRFLCVQVEKDDGRIVPGVFWLQIHAGRFHRFFIDEKVLFWKESNEIDERDLTYFDSDPPIRDIAVEFELVESVISRIQMRQTPSDPEFDCQLTISFADGRTLMLQGSEDESRLTLVVEDAARRDNQS